MHEITRMETTEKSSRVVKFNGMAFISGLTPVDSNADVKTQTRQVLKKIDHFLAMAGTNKENLLTAVVYSRESENIPIINSVWNEWVPEGTAPARTCVRATPARPEFVVEITVTASAS